MSTGNAINPPRFLPNHIGFIAGFWTMNKQQRFSNLKAPVKNLVISGLVAAAGAISTVVGSTTPANAQNSPVSPAPTTPTSPLNPNLGGTETPTPTVTPTPTPTPTPTVTPTPTPTPTPTVTPTPTPTETPTPTPTPTPESSDGLSIFDNWPLRRARNFSSKKRIRYFEITLGDMVRYKLTGYRNLGPGAGQPIRWYFDQERGNDQN